jgi:hypothetical protein
VGLHRRVLISGRRHHVGTVFRVHSLLAKIYVVFHTCEIYSQFLPLQDEVFKSSDKFTNENFDLSGLC